MSWKRFNAQLNLLWGTSVSKNVDKARVEFKGVTYPDPVTDDMRSWKRDKMAQILTKFVSWISVFFMGTASVLIFLGSLYLRETLIHVRVRPEKGSFEEMSLRLVSSGIFGLQVVLFEPIFKRVALVLTEWENHRRESSHRSNFVAKAFIFSVINNFTPVFYFAYVEQLIPRDYNGRPDLFNLAVAATNSSLASVGEGDIAANKDRLAEISLNLTAVFLTQASIGNVASYMLPQIYRCCMKSKPCDVSHRMKCCCLPRKSDSQKKEAAGEQMKKKSTPPPTTIAHTPHTSISDLFQSMFDQRYSMEFDDQEEYDNLQAVLVSNGYATVFAVAFPLGSLIACLGLQAEFKLDLFQQMNHYRRPFPDTMARHFAAERLLDLTSRLAILNNLCLLLFHDFANLKEGQLQFDAFPVVMLCVMTAFIWILAQKIEGLFAHKAKYISVIQKRFNFRSAKIMGGAREQGS